GTGVAASKGSASWAAPRPVLPPSTRPAPMPSPRPASRPLTRPTPPPSTCPAPPSSPRAAPPSPPRPAPPPSTPPLPPPPRPHPLDSFEQVRVEADLEDRASFGLTGQLRVPDLVGPGSKAAFALHAEQHIRSTQPAPVDERRLHDRVGALAHGGERALEARL